MVFKKVFYFNSRFHDSTYTFLFFLDRLGYVKPADFQVQKEFNSSYSTFLTQRNWIKINTNNPSRIAVMFDSKKFYQNFDKKINIFYKRLDQTNLDFLKQTENPFYNLSFEEYFLFSQKELQFNRQNLLDPLINNLITREFLTIYDLFYFQQINNFIFYGNLTLFEETLLQLNIDFVKGRIMDYDGVINFIKVPTIEDDSRQEICSCPTRSNYLQFLKNSKNCWQAPSFKILTEKCKRHCAQKKIPNLDCKIRKNKCLQSEIITLIDNFKIIESNQNSIKYSIYKFLKWKYQFGMAPRTQIDKITITLIDRHVVSLTVPFNQDAIWYPFDRRIFLWNDNNRLITGKLENKNTWWFRRPRILRQPLSNIQVGTKTTIMYQRNLHLKQGTILSIRDNQVDCILSNQQIVSVPKNKLFNVQYSYKYNIETPKSKLEFSNFLVALGALQKNTPFEFKRITLSDLLVSNLAKPTRFFRVGYNNEAIIVNNANQHWIDLLKMDFKFDPEYNWWYKFPLNFREPFALINLGIKESKVSIERESKKIKAQDIYLTGINQVLSSSEINIVFVPDEEIQAKLNQIPPDQTVSIYLETYFDEEEHSDVFSGSQMNYYHTVRNLWLSYKLDNFYCFSIPWRDVIQPSVVRQKLLEILSVNPKVCYNMKAIMVQLLKEEIPYSNFVDDLILQAWIYNPVFRQIRSPEEAVPEYSCQNKHAYTLKSIWNTFAMEKINTAGTKIKKLQMEYTVYPLILCLKLNPILKALNLYQPYLQELKANKVIAKSEAKGLFVNEDMLQKCQDCTQENIRLSFNEIQRLLNDEFVATYFQSDFIDLVVMEETEEDPQEPEDDPQEDDPQEDDPQEDDPQEDDPAMVQIDFHPEVFYRYLSDLIAKTEFAEPFIQSRTVKGSRNYIEFFMTKNETLLNSQINFKKFIEMIYWLLKYQYISKYQLPHLLENIDDSNEIHPCINTISRPGGRLDSTLPRFHFMPNTDKTIWGKWMRRCIQAKPGFTLITADWSAQEMLTIGLLSEDQTYISSINAGDQHVATAINIFHDQIITDIKTTEVLTLTLSNFDPGVSNTLYISDDTTYLKMDFNLISANVVSVANNAELLVLYQAAQQNNRPLNCVSKKQRTIAKRLNFGLMYGMGETTFRQILQISQEEMVDIISRWWAGYPQLRDFIRSTYKKGVVSGYVKTYSGRRYLLPQFLHYKQRIYDSEILGGELSEQVISYVNSGTAADWLKKSLILIDQQYQENQINGCVVATLHDEIVVEVATDQVDQAKTILENIMKHQAIPKFDQLGINVKVSVDVCPWWDSCTEEESQQFSFDQDVISNLEDLCPTI